MTARPRPTPTSCWGQSSPVFDAVLAAHETDVSIAAVAVSTFVGNLLGVDAHDRPVTPLLTYADTRAVPEVTVLRRTVDEAAVHQRTGCRLHTSYWPALLRWIAAARAEWLARTDQWITFGDYLQRKLLAAPGSAIPSLPGRACSTAIRCSGTTSCSTCCPSIEQALAPLIGLDAVTATLLAPWATRWPALARGAMVCGSRVMAPQPILGSGCAVSRHGGAHRGHDQRHARCAPPSAVWPMYPTGRLVLPGRSTSVRSSAAR